jgi:hypothetical protein
MALWTPSRRSFVGGLAALFAAPAIVRATSLMPVHALEPVAIALDRSDVLDYEYWANGPMGLARYTAREILAAPKGVYTPWLPEQSGDAAFVKSFRPVLVDKAGLATDPVRKAVLAKYPAEFPTMADPTASDPVVAKLRAERAELQRRIAEEHKRNNDPSRKWPYHGPDYPHHSGD